MGKSTPKLFCSWLSNVAIFILPKKALIFGPEIKKPNTSLNDVFSKS